MKILSRILEAVLTSIAGGLLLAIVLGSISGVLFCMGWVVLKAMEIHPLLGLPVGCISFVTILMIISGAAFEPPVPEKGSYYSQGAYIRCKCDQLSQSLRFNGIVIDYTCKSCKIGNKNAI